MPVCEQDTNYSPTHTLHRPSRDGLTYTSQVGAFACDVSRAQGESSGRKWGTGHRVRKGEGSLR
eukprot:1179521-Prorocentrum_minimum.AAC.4